MRILSIATALFFATAAGLAAAQESAGFTVFAIAAGQTAQVRVVNRASASAAPCHVSIAFADADGHPISDPNASNFALKGGRVGAASIAHPALAAGERYDVRLLVHELETKTAGRGECRFVRTIVEIYDTDTGRTTSRFEVATNDD